MIILQYDVDKIESSTMRDIHTMVSNMIDDTVISLPKDLNVLWDVDTTLLEYLYEAVGKELKIRKSKKVDGDNIWN